MVEPSLGLLAVIFLLNFGVVFDGASEVVAFTFSLMCLNSFCFKDLSSVGVNGRGFDPIISVFCFKMKKG